MSFAKNVSNNCSQKHFEDTKKFKIDAIKTASKREIPKTGKAIGDLVGKKIGNKITKVSKKSSKELHSQNDLEIPKERYVSLENRQQINEDLWLV